MKAMNLLQIKGLCMLLLSFVTIGIFQSCDKADEPFLIEKTSSSQMSQTEDIYEASELRSSGDITNPSWTPGRFDALEASKYEIRDPYQLSGDTYRFVVKSRSLDRNDLYIKYYSPQGDEVYEKMLPNRDYTSFEVQRTFKQEGIYHIRFYVASSRYGTYPSIHRDSYRVEVELPVNVPAMGDDYKQRVRKGGSDVNGIYDICSFYYYNCTSWVALKVNQMWGTQSAFNNKMFGNGNYHKLGHAWHWKEVLERNGYEVTDYPKAGSIIWFPPNQKAWDPINKKMVTYSTDLGHVGFVHEVQGDFVIWTEYHGGRETSYTEQTKTLDALPSSARFIHVQKRIY